MMPFITEPRAIVFPLIGNLYNSHGNYSRAMMANKSSDHGALMGSEENDFYFDLKAVSDSIDSGFIKEPEWVSTDEDFIKWVRGFAADGE